MLITVQHLLDSLQGNEYVYHGEASYKRNAIHSAVLSYDISALYACGRYDALFVIPPDGFFRDGCDSLNVLDDGSVRPAVLIFLVRENDLYWENFHGKTRFPVVFVSCSSRNDAKAFYRRTNSLLRVSSDEDILYQGITTGLLWEEQKYERNDMVFLCKLLGVENQGPYRVCIITSEAREEQALYRLRECLKSEYQIRMTVVWQGFLVGILAGAWTEREQFNKLHRGIVEDTGFEVKISLSSLKRSLGDIHSGLQEALRTYDLVGVLHHIDKNVLGYDELGIYQVLFELNHSTVFDNYCDAVFHSLWDYDRDNNAALFQTLESYFKNEFDMKKTATDLFVHINTLRYRINQIENIMGRDLKNIRDITEIETAFMVRTMTNVIF